MGEDVGELRERPQQLAARDRRLTARRRRTAAMPKNGFGTCCWSAEPSDRNCGSSWLMFTRRVGRAAEAEVIAAAAHIAEPTAPCCAGSSRCRSTENCWMRGDFRFWSLKSMLLPTPVSRPSEFPTGCNRPSGTGWSSPTGRPRGAWNQTGADDVGRDRRDTRSGRSWWCSAPGSSTAHRTTP